MEGIFAALFIAFSCILTANLDYLAYFLSILSPFFAI